jgi:hypothetical protein
MKKLFNLFLWFCTATLVAQCVIIGLSYFRGNLSGKSVTQIIALLNGIDIPGERLKNAIASGQEIPIPTRQEILDAKVQASLELDTKEKSLDRYAQQLEMEQKRQELENQKLAQRIQEHDQLVAAFKSGMQTESLTEVQRLIEVMAPDQAKVQLLSMWQNGSNTDVVTIIKALPEGNRKKIIAEFNDPASAEALSAILKAVRTVESKPVSTSAEQSDQQDSVK